MSRKPATRKTTRSASSIKSPGSSRQAAIWNPKLYERAEDDDTFIQVYLEDEELKRRPNNLKLTGATNMWEKEGKEDYIYEPVSRLAGPRDAVEQALNDYIGQIRKAVGDKSLTVSDLVKSAFNKDNASKSKAFRTAIKKAAKEKKAHLKATREAVQEGAFAPWEMEYVFYAFNGGKRGKKTGKKKETEKAKKPRKTGLAYMVSKARAETEKDAKEGNGEGPFVVDVSDITANGTGAHIIPLSRAERDELKTVSNVPDFIIYSDDPVKFNAAMRVLSNMGQKNYLKFQGKLDQSVSEDIARDYAKTSKSELKSYHAANKTEEEEEEGDEEEEEEEEKPKKKTTKKPTTKKAKAEEESEEEVKPKKTAASKAAAKKAAASKSKSKSKSKSASASPSRKPSAKPAAPTAKKSASRSGSPSRKPSAKAAAEEVPEPEETSAGAAASALRSKTAAKPAPRGLPRKKAPARPPSAIGSEGADDE